ncbi:MAG: hypothetical protein ABFD65_09710, partial [Candidatus Polarisedimenticolia bacterium]
MTAGRRCSRIGVRIWDIHADNFKFICHISKWLPWTPLETSMRAYERTHPFLTFALNANSFTHRLWMRLGEA